MPRCRTTDCPKKARFGLEYKKPMCCIECRTEDMTDVVGKRCAFDGCLNKATHNEPDEKKPLMCEDHASATMLHTKSKFCIGKNYACKVSATCNYPDRVRVGLYCVSCRLPGMVDVTSRRCIVEGCAKRPFYNVPGEKPNYCSDHMDKETMINVSNPRCLDCDQFPAFNFPGESAIYCAEHRKPDMINVICKYCAEDGCNKVPFFNFKGQKALYCGDHKKVRSS